MKPVHRWRPGRRQHGTGEGLASTPGGAVAATTRRVSRSANRRAGPAAGAIAPCGVRKWVRSVIQVSFVIVVISTLGAQVLSSLAFTRRLSPHTRTPQEPPGAPTGPTPWPLHRQRRHHHDQRWVAGAIAVSTTSIDPRPAQRGKASAAGPDPGRVYAGLLLDHDLPAQAVNAAEPPVTGTEVARGIARFVDPEIPILIHSLNAAGGRRMATTSTAGGFEVAPIPMAELTQDRLLARLETGRDVQRRLAPERTAARAPSPSGAADAETAPRASSRPHRLVPARSVSHPRQRWITALLPASSRPDRGSPDEAPRPPAPGVRNRSGRACRSGRDSARNGRGRYRSP